METLRDIIENRGLKQGFVAEGLKITRQHLSDIVCGKSMPSRKLALKIEDYFEGEITAPQLLFPKKC